jgi:hypothetical protein
MAFLPSNVFFISKYQKYPRFAFDMVVETMEKENRHYGLVM